MFDYAIRALHMSEAEAFLRIHAARMGRRFPLIVEMLGRGELHLTGIKLLAPHLTPDNHVQVLERARGKSKRAIEQLVAELAPQPDVPERLRKHPTPRIAGAGVNDAPIDAVSTQTSQPFMPAQTIATTAPGQRAATSAPTHPFTLSAPAPPSVPVVREVAFAMQSLRARASITPLRPSRFRLELTLGQETHDKLEQLRELL